MQLTRSFFLERGYLEVETPILAPCLIPEPAIEVFSTKFLGSPGHATDLYLVPSPELWMKRLLAEGSGSLFQIAKCFRNSEVPSRYHSPEFTMLEWYTVGHNYKDSMVVIDDLLAFLCSQMMFEWEPTFPCDRMSMEEAFAEFACLDLNQLWQKDALFEAAKVFSTSIGIGDTWEVIFNTLFVSAVEPRLREYSGLILYDYPAAIPTLAKTSGHNAERWELYLRGVEIANCYSEETSREKLELLFQREAERKQPCEVQPRADGQFPKIVGGRLPECSGAALGMDRLLMVLSGKDHLDCAVSFPFSTFNLEE